MNKLTAYSLILILIAVPLASAGISELFGKLTGKATSQPVNLQITVGGGTAPTITTFNDTMTDVASGLNEGPSSTSITIKFLATDAEGRGNLNDSSAQVTFTKGGENDRTTTCTAAGEANATSENYTCTLDMYWWDGAGTWDINTSVSDLNDNLVSDSTTTFTVGATTGFVSSPASLTWSDIAAGAANQEANEFITLNNTGNIARNIEFNATNLLGVGDNTKGLYAENFTTHTSGGCGGTAMVHATFQQVIGATLAKGNYSLSDGTGQEDVYICLEASNSDLTSQAYSTAEEGAWVLRITA